MSAVKHVAETRSIASSSSAHNPLFTSSSGASGSKDESFRMLMLAKPGAGKGTLSGRLMEKYDIKFLSTGDILRQHIKDQTEVGRAAEAIVAQGGLMPDELMLKLIASKLGSLKGKNWIIDGFPRTLGQGQRLDSYLAERSSPLSLVVHLDVPDEVIMARITDRWIHPGSGRIYNYSYNKPNVPGVDDVTGEPLVRRSDDDPKVYARRLKSFYDSTAPLLEYYNSQSPVKLVSLSGTTSDEIWPKLDNVVQSRFRLKPKTQASSSVSEAVLRQPASERKPIPDVSFA
ncbi:hypothetical protein FRB96_008177 [Tulasnella sp. 330]|nr:hypothetical protein FRB96_008177 [Tulasnella sp. 330]KAG8885989.1 hypothetical protein FRB97_008527 [Tulasnella sp. 331]